MKNFVTPHCHTKSLDTGASIESFAKREVELGTGYLVSTDHGTMAAARQVAGAAKKHGLTPVLGCEFYLRDDDCDILKRFGVPKDEKGGYGEFYKYAHVTAHFADNDAFETASRLLSKADERAERHGSERKPLFSWKDLEELGGQNVTYCSSCLIGIVGRFLVKHNNPQIAIAYYEKLRSLVKQGNFYVELFPHKCTHYWESGTFLTLEGGDRRKYHNNKLIMTNRGEMRLHEVQKALRDGNLHITAVKDYSTWNDLPEAKKIISVDLVEDFLLNECRPWAPDSDLQLGMNRFMLRLARKYGDKILVSDDAHFAYESDKVVQDIRLQSGGGSWRFHNSYHRQGSSEAFDYFRNVMNVSERDFESWVDNSHEWGSKFKDFQFKKRVSLPTKFYPENTLKHTFDLIKKHGRMDWNSPEYAARLKAEIQLLHKNGTLDLLPYFFVDEEVCDLYAANNNLVGCGRGSAAGLLLTYLLGITHVDPLKYNLSMDRFLTLDRIQQGKLPDIDLDFPSRDLLVGEDGNGGWLKERFGDHFCQISTDITLKLKSAIKDVARVQFGKVPFEIEELTKKMAVPPQGISDKDYVYGYTGADGTPVKGAIETDPYLQAFVKKYPEMWETVQKCLSLQRSVSRHASAYVICNEPIANFIPTTSVSGVPVTQFTAGSAEEAGALKYDFLVINSLKDVSDAIEILRKDSGIDPKARYTLNGKSVPGFRVISHEGQLYDIWDLPEDSKVFDDICEGKTETVFQFNTPAARQWLAHFNEKQAGKDAKLLDSIMALSNFTALDRPGPLDAMMKDETGDTHNMLVEYARRAKLGKGNYKSDLPILDELLPETHGVIVYQEQLTRIFKDIGKTTGMEAENFRVHISKKQMAKVAEDRDLFMKGAVQSVGEANAKKLWDMMFTFGQYGFNCISGYSRVKTLDGYVTMKKIVDNPSNYKVAYYDPWEQRIKYETPSHAQHMGQKEVLRVTFGYEWLTVEATKDHKFWQRDKWMTLEEIVASGRFYEWSGAYFDLNSVKNIGIQDVYDIEMPSHHNFILDGGVIAHNCSHAVSYVHISYACAFLKHHYPLQWWTAVLRNASKNEISEKFWTYCGHLIRMPDIKRATENFEIVGDQIQAPLSLLQGIGATAHEELVEISQSASNLPELFSAIHARRVANSKNGKQGRSSLSRRVVYTLVTIGAMDSFFPADFTILDKLMVYETEKAKHDTELKRKTSKTGRVKDIKPAPVDPSFVDLNEIQLFQLRKSILPSFSGDLIDMVSVSKSVIHIGDLGPRYKFYAQNLKMVNADDIQKWEESAWPDGLHMTVALPCYVQADERRTFGVDKREMAKLTFDAGGTVTLVKWPQSREDSTLGEGFEDNLTGCVGVAILNKSKKDRPFTVISFEVVQPPFKMAKEESSES
jgi:DNA polymerase III alpha subunit